jgi:hypothetical protein
MESKIERLGDIDRYRARYRLSCSEPECRETGSEVLDAEQAKEFETELKRWYCGWHRRFSDR